MYQQSIIITVITKLPVLKINHKYKKLGQTALHPSRLRPAQETRSQCKIQTEIYSSW